MTTRTLNILAVLVLLVFALTGCGGPEKLTPGQEEALKAFKQLPPNIQQALEAKALRGLTFYVTTDDQATQYEHYDGVVSIITSGLLENGAFRADNNTAAAIRVTISSPKGVNNPWYQGVFVHMTDKNGGVLLSGNYTSYTTGGNLDDHLSALIEGMGIEQRNKALAGSSNYGK